MVDGNSFDSVGVLMTTWKTMERRVAKQLGGRRITNPHGPDVVTDWLCVECKHREKLPEWLKSALEQARSNAGPNQLGIAVLHEKYQKDSLVLISYNDFRTWFGETGNERT